MWLFDSHFERRIADDADADEGDGNGDDVNCELELQELGDRVVHVPAPHDGLHDGREVVVGQDDVACLLCHVSSGDALQCKTSVMWIVIATLLIYSTESVKKTNKNICIF